MKQDDTAPREKQHFSDTFSLQALRLGYGVRGNNDTIISTQVRGCNIMILRWLKMRRRQYINVDDDDKNNNKKIKCQMLTQRAGGNRCDRSIIAI